MGVSGRCNLTLKNIDDTVLGAVKKYNSEESKSPYLSGSAWDDKGAGMLYRLSRLLELCKIYYEESTGLHLHNMGRCELEDSLERLEKKGKIEPNFKRKIWGEYATQVA